QAWAAGLPGAPRPADSATPGDEPAGDAEATREAIRAGMPVIPGAVLRDGDFTARVGSLVRTADGRYEV
ncbi:hypothetical protein, partial [Amycolatopsis sp. SID8362]|uniref:hypothetical protein n=1 Tax=Amycolatopsis sp. SID8362 TaxID=2690346 RepID=UPI00142D0C8C